jgi:hypothetical protein
VKKDTAHIVDIGAIVTQVVVKNVLMMCVIHVIVTKKKMTFTHEDFTIDLTNNKKGKLYKGNQLMFVGDGYSAITMMMRNCKDNQPVRNKFNAQLNTREKCKLGLVKHEKKTKN